MMNRISRNTVVALGLLAISMIILFWLIPTQVKSVQGYNITPRFFPYAIVTATAALCVIMLITSLKIREEYEKVPWEGKRLVIVLVALCILYIVAMEHLGYFVPTVLFLAAVLLAFGERRGVMVAAVSVVAALVIFLIFGNLLKLFLPKGLLSPLFEFLLY